MNVELQINNSTNPRARFVTWAPSPCRIRVTNPAPIIAPSVSVRITGRSAPNGGAIRFRSGASGAFSTSLTLTVPTNGASVPFFVAGIFGRPSTANGDVSIEARVGGTLVGSMPLMVRIRKNANNLTPGERDRFVAAFAQLNNQGLGRFADFRDMHTSAGNLEAHAGPGFLPWHRAYLLDLERELQAINQSVTLPYWRFDQPAPNLFTPDFIGVTSPNDPLGTVQFSASNPFRFWRTDGVPGVDRSPDFNTTTGNPTTPRNEASTLSLGALYSQFRAMQVNPHNRAHTSFDGFISDIPTAARDPLFFLLHCNVDRLWAKWQRNNGRFNQAVAASYDSNPGNRIGHNLPDTMWPWNGVTGNPRPPTAPGGTLAGSAVASAPGLSPRVRDMLDFQGEVNAVARMGFDYDDVRFV